MVAPAGLVITRPGVGVGLGIGDGGAAVGAVGTAQAAKSETAIARPGRLTEALFQGAVSVSGGWLLDHGGVRIT